MKGLSRELPVCVGGYTIFHLIVICWALLTQLEHMYLKMHLSMYGWAWDNCS